MTFFSTHCGVFLYILFSFCIVFFHSIIHSTPFFDFVSFSLFPFFLYFFLNSAGADKSDHTDKKAEKDDFAAFEDF
jgi:hypothetical protein